MIGARNAMRGGGRLLATSKLSCIGQRNSMGRTAPAHKTTSLYDLESLKSRITIPSGTNTNLLESEGVSAERSVWQGTNAPT
jgi:hypothetical protein